MYAILEVDNILEKNSNDLINNFYYFVDAMVGVSHSEGGSANGWPCPLKQKHLQKKEKMKS